MIRYRRNLILAASVALATSFAPRATAQTAEKWDPAIQKFEEGDKVSPPPQNGVLFIGASSIVRWNLPEYFPELGAKAINRGFGGSQSVDAVRYVDRIVVPYHPRVVVYYAGDNDVEANIPAQEIAHQFALFDQKVHAALPQTKIVFISIKPSIRRWKWIDTIRSALSADITVSRFRERASSSSVESRGTWMNRRDPRKALRSASITTEPDSCTRRLSCGG